METVEETVEETVPEAAETTETAWAPLDDAMAQMKDFDEKAREMVRTTADDVRQRSEKALGDAREQTEKTLQLVRKNLDEARESIETRSSDWPVLRDVPAYMEKQLASFQTEMRKGLESLADALRISTHKDIQQLADRITELEEKLETISAEKAA